LGQIIPIKLIIAIESSQLTCANSTICGVSNRFKPVSNRFKPTAALSGRKTSWFYFSSPNRLETGSFTYWIWI